MHLKTNESMRSVQEIFVRIITFFIVLILPLESYGFRQNFNPSTTSISIQDLDLTNEEREWLSQHKEISVGVKHSWKPIEFVSDQKKFRGITIDYLNTLEPILGVQFNKINIDEKTSQHVDILSSVGNPTTLDQTKYSLTESILKFRYAIYVHKKNKNITGLDDLSNKQVAVFKYGQLVKYLENDHPKLNLLKINEIEEAFNEMDSNHSLAYIGNEMVVDYEANLQGISYLNKVGYAPIKTELRMAVRKDWPIFISILNKSFLALAPKQEKILSNWDLSLFKSSNIYISIALSILVFLAGYLILKAFKLKRAMEKQEQDAQNLIWHQAHFDTLTDLPNRMLFHRQMRESFAVASKDNSFIGFLYIDLDAFKHINDVHGHSTGDELITVVANRLKKCVRTSDHLARLSGDEFAIIITDIEDLNMIDQVANRILALLSQPYEINNCIMNITSSIGSSVYPNDTDDIETLVKYADMAMYEAKRLGKNRYQAFTQSMQDKASHKQAILIDLKTAVTANELRIHYQPIVNLKTNKMVKAEALIRWQHPHKGMIGPLDFISIAEDSNAICEIGNWVFEQALKDIVTLQEKIHPAFSISINVSPKQLGADSLLIKWPKQLQKQGLAENSLGIEITEGLLLEVDPNVNQIFHDLRNIGVQLLIDDFGTGYSSLSYLKKLEVDYIKIDRYFVRNLSLYSEDMVLCEAIIVMAHKLGLKVIAEGIETVEQRDLLQSIGCDFGQGYLFSKPKPLEELLLDYQSTAETTQKIRRVK
jgi:diguanylate cyclase (GGDEF)-like protein